MTTTLAALSPLRRHPTGLWVLAATELWERVSYYGMRALLIYYLTKQLLFSQPQASAIYGAYTATVWFTPLLGGIIGDRFGQHRSVVTGGALMALGHFMMAFPALLYPALTAIAFGCGLFKPNVSTQIGDLYAPTDPRRDRAYGLFYMGINVGGFLAPLLCGTIGELYGWDYGFGVAGVGMTLGLVIYLLGRAHLPPDRRHTRAVAPGAAPDSAANARGTRRRVFTLVLISLSSVLFWAAFEQQGNTIALWADTFTQRQVRFDGSSLVIPATWFQSLNSLFIVALTPLIAGLWKRQSERGTEPPTVYKMVIGAAFGALAFLGLAAAAAYDTGPASPLWLVLYFVLITFGEIYLSPTCLSLFNQVAPLRHASTLLGVWYLSLFLGSYLAGYAGTWWSRTPKPLFFFVMAAFCAASALALYAVGRVQNVVMVPAKALPLTL